VIGLHRINKSNRLAALDGLREGAMWECILHIELVNWLGAGDSQAEHGADRGWLDYRVECLIVVDTGLLGEATKNPASLVPVQGAIEIELVLENPLAGNDVGANGTRDKIPGIVGDQGSKLFFHVVMPVQIGEGGVDGGGYQRQSWCRGGRQGESVGRKSEAPLHPHSFHRYCNISAIPGLAIVTFDSYLGS
jgi:hypothetical protein